MDLGEALSGRGKPGHSLPLSAAPHRRSILARKKARPNPAAAHRAERAISPAPVYSAGTMTRVEANTKPKMPWKAAA